MSSELCVKCGHSRRLHEMTDGYQPYGRCNFQWDLCGCRRFISEGDAAATQVAPPGSVVLTAEQVKQVREDVDFLYASIHWEMACAAHDRARDRVLAMFGEEGA